MIEKSETVGALPPTSASCPVVRSDSMSREGHEPNRALPQSFSGSLTETEPSCYKARDSDYRSPPGKIPGLRLLPLDALMQPQSSSRALGIPYCRSPDEINNSYTSCEERSSVYDRHSTLSAASSVGRAGEYIPAKRRFRPYPSHSQSDRFDLGRLDVATIKCVCREPRSSWTSYPEYGKKGNAQEPSFFSPHASMKDRQWIPPANVHTFRDASLRPYLRRAETTPTLRPPMTLRTYSDKVLSTNTSYQQSPLSPFSHSSPNHFSSMPRGRDSSSDYPGNFRFRQTPVGPEPDEANWSKTYKPAPTASKIDKISNKTTKSGRPGHRSRSTGNMCQSCNATSTPEWRKGPMGPRSLCNACGLLYAKMCRKSESVAMLDAESKQEDPIKARQAAIDELNKPEKQQQFLEALRAGVRASANSKNRVQAGSSVNAGTPVSSSVA